MKKMLVMASLATILGLSFYSATHSDFSAVGEKDEDKTYIVTVGGDVLKDDAKTLKRYRNQVLSQIAYELPEGSKAFLLYRKVIPMPFLIPIPIVLLQQATKARPQRLNV